MINRIRPTKKQYEVLVFIDQFTKKHGYSPSYREIMEGLDYTSVATIALHVNSLIKRGHLTKRENSSRSLEVIRYGRSKRHNWYPDHPISNLAMLYGGGRAHYVYALAYWGRTIGCATRSALRVRWGWRAATSVRLSTFACPGTRCTRSGKSMGGSV